VNRTSDTANRLTRRRALGGPLALGALAACAPGAAPGQPPTAGGAGAGAGGKVIWGHRSQTSYDQLAQDALPLFKQQFPKIEVEYQPVTGAWNEKFTASWAAGSGPDVFEGWDQWFWQFGAKGVLVNVNDRVRDLKKADVEDFAAWQWEGFQIPNTAFRFAMPKYINMGVVYVNKAALARSGAALPPAAWSHDDYADLLRRTTRPAEGVFGGFIPYASFTRYQPHLRAYGASMVDPKDNTKAAYHLPAAAPVWDWLWNRMFQDNTLIQRKQETELGFSGGIDGLAQGKLATVEEGMSNLQLAAERFQFDWDLLPIPRGPARRASWGTTDGWGMWKGGTARDASWELVKFLSGPEYLKLHSKATLQIPPRRSLLDDWMTTVRQRYPVLEQVNLNLVKEALASAQPYVSVNQQLLCYQEMNAAFQPILDQVFRDGTQRPTYLRDTREQVEQAAASCGATFQ
jgi:multiple sugar transport system substrate-binding protein